MCVYRCVALTLNDVGDHEGGAGVVADEATAGQIAFNLQGKQIPGEKTTERTKDERGRDKRQAGSMQVIGVMHTL